MKVGIFETEHFEGAYPVIKLFDNGENNLTIFTYSSSYHQFEFLFSTAISRFGWIVKKEKQSKRSFIYTIYKKVKQQKIELLYLNTVTDNYIFYALMILLLRKVRVIVTLHDINTYFEINPPYTFRKLVRYTGKKCMLKLVKEFNVVSQTMVATLQNKLPAGKIVHCVPGSVFESVPPENNIRPISENLKIVVPGVVDKRRRNYDIVFEILEKCNALKLQVSVTLLGGISKEYGSDILQRSLRYSDKYSNLVFYEQAIVDQPEFDRVMNAAHFVFIPSVIKTIIADNVEEVYGSSIASGNLFDIIKHAKPFIAPDLLNVDGFLEQSCFRYKKTDEILFFLQELIDDPSNLQSWNKKALIASKHFTIEEVRDRNKNLFG